MQVFFRGHSYATLNCPHFCEHDTHGLAVLAEGHREAVMVIVLVPVHRAVLRGADLHKKSFAGAETHPSLVGERSPGIGPFEGTRT